MSKPYSADGGALCRRRVTIAERRAVMLAAHRTRKALGLSMSDALKQAWKQLRRCWACRWPTHRIVMPYEQQAYVPEPTGRRLYTRSSGRLAHSFAS